MTPEIAEYTHLVLDRIALIDAALRDLTEDELNRAPAIPGGNSAFVIATHTLGNLRAWVLGIACGADLRRDRTAEFRSHGTHEDISKEAARLSSEVEAALAGLDPATLNDRYTPTQELFGEGALREVSRRYAILHPIEHASIHLGHIHMTVDLLKAAR